MRPRAGEADRRGSSAFQTALAILAAGLIAALHFYLRGDLKALFAAEAGLCCAFLWKMHRRMAGGFGLIFAVLGAISAFCSGYYASLLAYALGILPLSLAALLRGKERPFFSENSEGRLPAKTVLWVYALTVFASAALGLLMALAGGSLPFFDGAAGAFVFVCALIFIRPLPQLLPLFALGAALSALLFGFGLRLENANAALFAFWCALAASTAARIVRQAVEKRRNGQLFK